MNYQSKDFAKIPSHLSVNMPEKLIHKNITLPQGDSSIFSAERHHFVSIVDLPSKTMSMTLGGLKPQQSTRRHRHNYETLIYIIKGYGHSIIEDQIVAWQKGDAIYIPVWAWHCHVNLSGDQDCLYIACENAPLLQNLGQLGLREEAT
ncbi:cupin [Legionella norrlandica]|uniref:Cupin n=1 Tax=Legionella norrlandica TaxID=1498499 RepID=A0A0A2SU02_9GAMM|nr:cupin domain-containing protein [Legionella norrlandica]KGP64237.1 cupin [Legionella norrlandica]